MLALVTGSPRALAQAPKIDSSDVNFQTADGVELQGVMYKSSKNGPQPTVILVHSPSVNGGKGSSQGDWHGLANTLAGEGFNVLRFDFRGHGKSDLIKLKQEFWNNPINLKYLPTSARKNPKPESLKSSEYLGTGTTPNRGYLPMLVNDLMGARVLLDTKNDAGDLNTSSVYLIGAGDAAIVGMQYIIAEWDRPQVQQPGVNISQIPLSRLDLANLRGKIEWAGKDIAGAIWLSPTQPSTFGLNIFQALFANKPQARDANKMLFLYGADDPIGKKGADYYFNQVLVANPPKNSAIKLDPVRLTRMEAIPKSKLAGVELLGQNLGTEKIIVKYLQDLEADRKVVARIPRNYTSTPFVNPLPYGTIR
jgi:pimeloyl-ACP methyl ester carboxylesterase